MSSREFVVTSLLFCTSIMGEGFSSMVSKRIHDGLMIVSHILETALRIIYCLQIQVPVDPLDESRIGYTLLRVIALVQIPYRKVEILAELFGYQLIGRRLGAEWYLRFHGLMCRWSLQEERHVPCCLLTKFQSGSYRQATQSTSITFNVTHDKHDSALGNPFSRVCEDDVGCRNNELALASNSLNAQSELPDDASFSLAQYSDFCHA